MEQLQFGYPYPDDVRNDLESEFSRVSSPIRLYVIAVICIALAAGCFVLFLIFGGLITPVIGAAALFGAAYVVRSKTNNAHLLEISAYETYIELDYYNAADDRKIHLSLSYPAIKSCMIDEDNYTTVKLIYRPGKEHYEKKVIRLSDGRSIDKSKQTTLFLRLNEGTPEQEFFLFLAPKLFKMTNSRAKINKRFGSHDNYRKVYYGEDIEIGNLEPVDNTNKQ